MGKCTSCKKTGVALSVPQEADSRKDTRLESSAE